MPKRVFWPAALVIMGLIFLAQNLGYLPPEFWNFWPLILIIVGLGGLLTSDREEWMVEYKATKAATPAAKPAQTVSKKVAPSKSV
jgi:hypothetical protein